MKAIHFTNSLKNVQTILSHDYTTTFKAWTAGRPHAYTSGCMDVGLTPTLLDAWMSASCLHFWMHGCLVHLQSMCELVSFPGHLHLQFDHLQQNWRCRNKAMYEPHPQQSCVQAPPSTKLCVSPTLNKAMYEPHPQQIEGQQYSSLNAAMHN